MFVLSAIYWIDSFITTGIAFRLGIMAYAALVVAIAWSSLRHRPTGWIWGLLLAIILATLPWWVWQAEQWYEQLVK